MRYPFKCPEHGEVEVVCSMNDVQTEMPCPECGKMCTRIYTSFMFGGDLPSKKPKKITDPSNKNWKDKPKEGYI
jgi:putative FmdB family regulatory protein